MGKKRRRAKKILAICRNPRVRMLLCSAKNGEYAAYRELMILAARLHGTHAPAWIAQEIGSRSCTQWIAGLFKRDPHLRVIAHLARIYHIRSGSW